uniref:Reverse transcriptase domain-containing protein n=1 Tax=Tanacetum cinerariifolium TaxID=118510 RepID=A0A699HQ13_TANCI|nr:reverse transcriptase domain-containing protein [Tanacetum cinerariifolium]
MAVIRNNLGWKVKDLRGMTFEEVEAKFNSVCKQMENFIPMGSKEEAGRIKRKGINLEQESAKKQKSSEEFTKEAKSPEEVPEEKVKEMMNSVPTEEVYVEALQVKHPIIDWKESVNQVNLIDVASEEYAQEVLKFLDSSTSGNPTPSDPIIASSSPSFTSFDGSDFILEEIETFLRTPKELSTLDDDFDPEGDIALIEKLLNENPCLNLPPMKNKGLEQANVTMTKPSTEETPELELKDLPSHLEYAFLEGTDKLPDDFKPAIQHQRRVNPKIHEVIKKEVIKLLDAGLIYPISDSPWEKCHFMIKEGIVLGHKIYKSGIEVDIAIVDVIAKLPHPTSVKEKESPFIFSKECIKAFNILKKKLTEALILVASDWDLPFEIMCDASDFTVGAVLGQQFDVIIRDKKEGENLAADHLSRLENPHKGRRSYLKEHQEMDHQYPTVAKIPVLDTGKFEQWQFWIQQYLQHEHYDLWEVIEFRDSYVVPANTTTTDTTSGEKSRRTVTLTAEYMHRKKNDVKARTTLLLSLLDEHQL